MGTILHPDELIMFFGTLFNSYNTTLKPNFPKSNNLEDDDDVEEMLLNDTNNKPNIKQVNNNDIIKISVIQIMHYNTNHRRIKTPLHIMNASAIYDKCQSCELIL